MSFHQSGRRLAVRRAIRKHGRPVVVIEREELRRLLPGRQFRRAITHLIYSSEVFVYYGLR
jgi:hypothetical protein